MKGQQRGTRVQNRTGRCHSHVITCTRSPRGRGQDPSRAGRGGRAQRSDACQTGAKTRATPRHIRVETGKTAHTAAGAAGTSQRNNRNPEFSQQIPLSRQRKEAFHNEANTSRQTKTHIWSLAAPN